MHTIRIPLKNLTYQTPLLVAETKRLQEGKKGFAFTKSFYGSKVFLATCHGIQKNLFFIPTTDFDYKVLTKINILISQSELLDFSLDAENQVLLIEALSDEKTENEMSNRFPTVFE